MKKTAFLIFIIIIFALGIFLSSMGNSKLNQKDMQDFVQTNGKELYLNGKQYRSVGVNRYNLLTHNKPSGELIGCASPFSEDEIERSFSQLEDLGVTTVRFWLFQSFTQSGDDMARFNFVLETAEKHNMKIIPVFENHWHDCTEGNVKTARWYANEYKSPYGNYSLSLKDYISKIVPQYKDNPTILSWEIMNEANTTDVNALYNFAVDVSGHIKSIDEKHLVSVGVSGTRESKADYQRLSDIKTIDILDYHDYDKETESLPDTLIDAFEVSEKSNKPLIVGEAGIKKEFSDRPHLFEVKMNSFFDKGGSVYMIWSYGDSYITDDGFNFDMNDPLSLIIKNTAAKVN